VEAYKIKSSRLCQSDVDFGMLWEQATWSIKPPLTEIQVKKLFFHSFPPKGQQQFIRSGQHVATMPLVDIIELMLNANSFADAQG
jgi:hypothetical protein